MCQWPEHSVQGYLTRLPTDRLEFILCVRNDPADRTLLTDQDYALILEILRTRPDSRFFPQE